MFKCHSESRIFLILIIFTCVFHNVFNLRLNRQEAKIIKEIKDVLESFMEEFGVEKTVPYSNEQLLTLINKFPTHDNDPDCFQNEICAVYWLDKVQDLSEKIAEHGSYLEYAFATNITDENQKLVEEFAPISSKFSRIILETSKKFYENSNDWRRKTKRMLRLISSDIVLKNEEDIKKFSRISSELESIYAKAKVCKNNQADCYSLEPELSNIMAKSRDYNELLWAWKGWSDVTGPKMKDLYTESIKLQNKAAKDYGYKDLSAFWMEDFEMDDFESVVDDIFEQLKPFYQQLHAYVRRKLREFYGSDKVNSNYIPAHLLGNMWAQSWDSIYDIVAPYPNVAAPRVTEALVNKGYTPIKIFKESENFFTSIGLYPMTPSFWKYSMIVKPSDRDVQCHASASSFSNSFDFRIKMCTEVNEDDFFVVHHEMGHIEYYMSYTEQPFIFRNGANSAFHEAIGDTIALSVFTSKHLNTIGILDHVDDSYESNINFLMNIALKKLAFLPFGYLIDKWRWGVFKGTITPETYNQMWWQMRRDYQGVESPIERTENDFDPGAKYHVPANVPYVRYFISHIHQFQFYRALCNLANHKGLLHKCDFYGSSAAGEKLKQMLSLGSSRHWSYALKLLTGESTINMNAFLEYFQPLIDWLKEENNKHSDTIGW